jgi:hypothetical protein
MDMQHVSPVFIDWMTAVGTVTTHGTWLDKFLQYNTEKPIHGAFHHTHGVEYYPSGFRHYFSPHRVGSEAVLVATGEPLRNIRRESGNDHVNKVVGQIARVTDHFSRIDLSCDIFDSGYLAHKIYQDLENGSKIFGRRKIEVRKQPGVGNGLTIYVGARTSPKCLRIYDKNAESQGEIGATRFEFELKADASEAVTERLRQELGWSNVTGLFNHMLLQFADWSNYPVIEQLTLGEVITLHIPERERLLNKKEWLGKQVLPTFVKDWDSGGSELWDWFVERVNASHE